jgi:hypothetical protein
MNRLVKRYLIASLVFGAIMGLLMGGLEALDGSKSAVTTGLLWGIGSAVLFGPLLGFVEARQRKNFEGQYVCAAGETLLREDLVRDLGKTSNPFSSRQIHGYMRLTNRRVHFQPGKRQGHKPREFNVLLTDIIETKAYRLGGWAPTGLHLRTAQGDDYFAVVFGTNREWAEAIMRAKTV